MMNATDNAHVDLIRVSLPLLIGGEFPTLRAQIQHVAQVLLDAGIRLAPNAKCQIERLDPNPKKRPHAMATKRDDPCPECGSHWQRPAIDMSDPDAEEAPVFSACAIGRDLSSASNRRFWQHVDSTAALAPRVVHHTHSPRAGRKEG